VKDLELLQRVQLGIDNERDGPANRNHNETLDGDDDFDMHDSDDEIYDPANPDHDDYF
jgi:hypothetical protein